MKGQRVTVTEVDEFSSARDSSRSRSGTEPRKSWRGFLVDSESPEPTEEDEVIWNMPPTYPFDGEDPKENSGFIS